MITLHPCGTSKIILHSLVVTGTFLFLGLVFDGRGLEAFFPVLSIKFSNLDFWLGVSFRLQINAHVGDPVSIWI